MRLFIGLSLPTDVRYALGAVCNGLDGAKWVKPENLHMTLRFIGEVGRGEASDLDAALAGIAAPAFDLRCQGLGNFGKGDKLRSVWVGVETSDALARLQEKVESAAARAGFGAETRKFKPHITLARFRGRQPRNFGGFLAANGAFATAPFPVRAFTLFESHMGHGGSHYVPLSDYPLTEAPHG
ncbi:MAG: RNA 2',3'-cyclic phosphodiesterase [Rhodospirillaceae bacterium]